MELNCDFDLHYETVFREKSDSLEIVILKLAETIEYSLYTEGVHEGFLEKIQKEILPKLFQRCTAEESIADSFFRRWLLNYDCVVDFAVDVDTDKEKKVTKITVAYIEDRNA